MKELKIEENDLKSNPESGIDIEDADSAFNMRGMFYQESIEKALQDRAEE